MKEIFTERLEYLRNLKKQSLGEIMDQLRKNFTKSLDHKSFQYKDFLKKYMNKQQHIRLLIERHPLARITNENELSNLFGVGEKPDNHHYRYFNTFGKQFGGEFSRPRVEFHNKIQDFPIDMKFMEQIDTKVLMKHQSKFPSARFLFDNPKVVEISLKLLLLNMKSSNQHHQSLANITEKH
jgi:hypothetical protein